ncbi:MAG: tetratricopeptide repeat protein [Thermodesulfovibrionia bacterium]|nr:tetratricopeptide repeat protein [Thermodesulfovibrionia bacterium]
MISCLFTRRSVIIIFLLLVALIPANAFSDSNKEAENKFWLGKIQGTLGKYQEAVDAFKEALRINPDYAEAYYYLGAAYSHLNRYQEAADACKQAIRIKPDYAIAHLGLGISYSALGDKGSALEEYKILKDLDKEMADKLFNVIYK